MRKFILYIPFIVFCTTLWAEVPQKMTFQTVVYNNTNQLVKNQIVQIISSILKDSLKGKTVYSEIQSAPTNANGLVSLTIGNALGFDTIQWESGVYYLKTEIQLNGTSISTQVSQLSSVPFALHSASADSLTTPIFSSTQQEAINQLVSDSIRSPQNDVYEGGILGVTKLPTVFNADWGSNTSTNMVATVSVPSNKELQLWATFINVQTSSDGTETYSNGDTYTLKITKIYDFTRKPYEKSYTLSIDVFNGSTSYGTFGVSPERPVAVLNGNHKMLFKLISESVLSITTDYYVHIGKIDNPSEFIIQSAAARDMSATKTVILKASGDSLIDVSGLRTNAVLEIMNAGSTESSVTVATFDGDRNIRLIPGRTLKLSPGETKKIDIAVQLDESEKNYFGPVNLTLTLTNAVGNVTDTKQLQFNRVP